MDWNSQELGIGAALSQDPALIAACESGDVYLAFAKACGLAPPGATSTTHPQARELCKTVLLGLQYGLGAASMALRLDRPPAYAEDYLRHHRALYATFWRWSWAAVSYGTAYGRLVSRFGWPLRVTGATKPGTLANFPMQANGAEMLRVAVGLLTAAGVRVCGTVHDALLVEAPLVALDDIVATTRRLMADASAIVLDGFRLRTSATVVRYPDRYQDSRGAAMWDTLARLLPASELQEDCDENSDPAGDARGAALRPGDDVVSAV